MKKILISGFEPFGNDSINPSLEAVKLLDQLEIANAKIHIVQTPVVRYKSIDTVIDAIKKIQPHIVITVGQAGGRAGITPERVAINVDDFRIKDNEGNMPIDQPIFPNASNAYFSSLPIKAIVKALQSEGIPSHVSNSAGTFVCNHLFYGVEHFIRSNSLEIRHGFIHIPYLPEQVKEANEPSMGLELIVKSLKIAVKATLENEKDLVIKGGEIC